MRVRLNSLGLLDALDTIHGFPAGANAIGTAATADAQYGDLVALARLMINLACMAPRAAEVCALSDSNQSWATKNG